MCVHKQMLTLTAPLHHFRYEKQRVSMSYSIKNLRPSKRSAPKKKGKNEAIPLADVAWQSNNKKKPNICRVVLLSTLAGEESTTHVCL